MNISTQKLSVGLALFLVVYNVGIYITHSQYNKTADYLIYLFYFLGLFFVAYNVYKQNNTQNFVTLFSKVIRTVVVCTLFIVIWTFLSQYIFPEVKAQNFTRLQTDMQSSGMSITDMEQAMKNYKSNFMLMYISKEIFKYGIIGAFFTLVNCVAVRIMK